MTAITADEQTIRDVFEGLAAKGILAKPNHLCCSSCASSDLYGEVKDDDRFSGVAWYHEQDDDGVREGGSLYIGFAAKDEQDDRTESAILGHTIKDALEEADLTVVWNGDPHTRIRVDDLHFEEHEKCDECGNHTEHCECCWTCETWPCECCGDCGQAPDYCDCDEHCDDCGEHNDECSCSVE